MSLSVFGSVVAFFFQIVSSVLSFELFIDGFTVGTLVSVFFAFGVVLIFFRVFLGGK